MALGSSNLEQHLQKMQVQVQAWFLALATVLIPLLIFVPRPTGFGDHSGLAYLALVLVGLQALRLLRNRARGQLDWSHFLLSNLTAVLVVVCETISYGTQVSLMVLLWPLALTTGFQKREAFLAQCLATVLSVVTMTLAKTKYVRQDEQWWVDVLALSIPLMVTGSLMSFFREAALREASQLAQQATTDYLTGLPNRHRLFNTFAQWSPPAEAKQHAVIMLDLDHFKRVNDRYGHQEGDALLLRFAQELRRDLRSEELVVRMGGEEFLWLATGRTLDEIVQRTEGLRLRVGEALADRQVTVSAGIAPFRVQQLQGRRLESLIHEADGALYQAKVQRNCVCVSPQIALATSPV